MLTSPKNILNAKGLVNSLQPETDDNPPTPFLTDGPRPTSSVLVPYIISPFVGTILNKWVGVFICMDLQENILRIKKVMGINEQENPEQNNTIEFCKRYVTPQIFEDAKTFYKNWILSPEFKEKVKNKYGWDDNTIETKIKDWLSFLSKITLEYITSHTEFLKNKGGAKQTSIHGNPTAFVLKDNPEKVYVVCNTVKEKNTTDSRKVKSLLVHEIQHSIDFYNPINKKEQIKKVVDSPEYFANEKSIKGNNNISKLSKLLSINLKVLEKICLVLLKISQYEQPNHCNYMETMARISSVREYFGLTNPSQKINVSVFKNVFLDYDPNVLQKNNGRFRSNRGLAENDMGNIIICWASMGFPDFEQLVNNINDLAKSKSANQNQGQV